ncbi:branched-chain amino acid ABC transporter permease [Rhizomonospora bruguierae]|uniref:branched-chain amino acid ABC transporter permease n=1 Tax=Rhizomonospora bruguierae TaxID=1581705 RepID=UPI001BCEB42B|nr:branched-chain amino acid ABC transporter permease [Micromonospora sp. NBRC 107566]
MRYGKSLVVLAVVTVLMLLLPAVGPSNRVLSLATLAAIYAIVTYGIALLFGTGGLLSIAHGGLWGIGAYTAALFAVRAGWSFLPVLVLSVVITAGAATLVALMSLRVRGHYFTIITFAVAEGIRALINAWTPVTAGTEGIVVVAPVRVFGFDIRSNADWYYIVVVSLAVVIALTRLVVVSRFGRRFAATRDNLDLAASVGIGVSRLRLLAFSLSGALAGLGGAYWAYSQTFVHGDQFGAAASIVFILCMLLGGARYTYGPLIGAVIVVFMPPLLALPPLLATAALGVVFILVILLTPGGLASLPERLGQLWRRWRGPDPRPPGAGAAGDGAAAAVPTGVAS